MRGGGVRLSSRITSLGKWLRMSFLKLFGHKIRAKDVSSPNGNMSDFIIAQGLSNGWYYRKWDSGIMEMWRTATLTLGSESSWGNVKTQSIQTVSDYPFEFTEVPATNVTLNNCSSGYNGWLATKLETVSPTSKNPGSYQYVRGTSGTSGTVTLSFYSIGKWK